jgi:hypothetical protein
MSLKLNSSGGGSVTLQEPTTASNVTLNLPAADGTVIYSDSSGNVGIGTSSVTTTANKNLEINGAAGTDSAINLSVNGTRYGIHYASASVAISGSHASIPYALYTGNTERARIDSSGNLLVGTTTAYSDGTLGAPAFQVSVLNGSRAGIATVATGTTDIAHIGFVNPNGLVGRISTSGSSTSYVTSSDYRLKENIAPMVGALATVAALKPVTYQWKIDGSAGQGFIAHELQAVVPDCVTGEKDAVDSEGNPVYQGIDTSFLVATLTAAIQELKAEVDSLRAQVEAQ